MMWFFRSYIPFLISFVIGSICYPIHSLWTHMVLFLAVLPIFFASRKMGIYALMIALLFESGVGLRYFHENSFDREQKIVRTFANQRIWIEGRVVNHPVPSENGFTFLVETKSLQVNNENFQQQFLIQIFSKTTTSPEKEDLIRIQTKLYMFSNPNNLQKIRNIQAYGTVFSDKQFELAHSANLFSTQIREHIFTVAKQYLTPKNFEYYRVMVFGDQALLGEDTMQRLKQTGLLHLFVISGSHIIYVGLIGFCLLRLGLGWIPRFHRTKYFFLGLELGSVVAVFLFLQLINPPVSTFRAVASMVLFVLLNATQRSQNSLANLGLVFFIVIITNPLYLFDVSTQLTFGSVAGILIFSSGIICKKLSEHTGKIFVMSRIQKAVLTTTGAMIFTAPILYIHFHQFYVASFFYNVLIVPTIGTVLSFVSVLSLVWAALPIDIVRDFGFGLLDQLFIWFEKILYFDVRKELYTVGSLFTRVSEVYFILAGFLFGILLWLYFSRNRKQMIQC